MSRLGCRTVPLFVFALLLLGAACTSKPSDDVPVGAGGSAPGSGGAGGTTGGGSPSTGGSGGGTPATGKPGDPAFVRFCNSLTADKQPLMLELEVGGHKLAASSSSCAPAVGSACQMIPSGDVPIKMKVGTGDWIDLGMESVKPGAAYVINTTVLRNEDRALPLPEFVPLDDATDCAKLTFNEATLRINPPLMLEPFKADGFTFAKPVGLERTNKDPHRYVFEGKGALNRFEVSYLGRLKDNQAPEPQDLLEKALADRKLKLVGMVETGHDYAAATADSGVAGPGRYVRLMYIRHWDMPYEYLRALIDKRPETVDVFTAEFAFELPGLADYFSLPYMLKSIAWGISVPADEIAKAELPGIWETASAGFAGGLTDWVDSNGNWVGGLTDGTIFKLRFDDKDGFELMTAYSARCSGAATPSCFIEGVAAHISRGRYLLDGGVLVLQPRRCESRFYDKNLVVKDVGGCRIAKSLYTVRMFRGENGRLSFSGLGHDPIQDGQLIWGAARKQGQPGSWMPSPARAAVAAPAGTPGVSICGTVLEKEPNDTAEIPGTLTAGQDFTGCIPNGRDVDRLELVAPADGYFTGGLVGLSQGQADVEVDDASNKRNLMRSLSSKQPGAPIFFHFTVKAGQKYQVLVRSWVARKGWFKYTVNLGFQPVADTHEPNDTAEMARAISLGTPVLGYFFYVDDGVFLSSGNYLNDYYAVPLQPGMASFRLDDVPADVTPTLTVRDPEGTIVSAAYIRGTKGTAIMATAPITLAGTHKVELSFYGSGPRNGEVMTRDEVPPSFKQPYKLLVTQP